MSSKPDPAWERFASREPHFAVVTDPRFLQANLTPEHERQFFASGESLVAWMLGVIDAALMPQFAPMSTLELGCGIGRLALPLAQRPGTVVAVDRSPAMLERARAEAARRGLDHIVFQDPAALIAAPRRFDLVVCYHVMQRLRREEALALLRQLTSCIGPDGVGVVQWCCRTRESMAVDAARSLRERIPAANRLANRLRGKPSDEPFVPTHVLEIDEVLAELDAADLSPVHLALERHERLDYAIAFARRRSSRAPQARTEPAGALSPRVEDAGDAEIEAWNRAAEEYFASLKTWDHHLAKPFGQIEETPTLLASVAVLLQAVRLTRGMTVLEFGAGTGWLSRFVTQMGCRAILLDVSTTALRIAREHYARQPVVGPSSEPVFLEFDGRRIDLPDASVDRVICFDAFHHAANPQQVLAEFARVLRPGGIAGFVEPGPRHAEAPRSRFEADTYGVVERDVDVHEIWRTAHAAGFADLRMCVFHAPPYHVSLGDYEDLLAGGAATAGWLAATRNFLRNVRSFYLVKSGTEAQDSRNAAGLACEIHAVLSAAGASIAVDATVSNTGTTTWLPWGREPGGVGLGFHLYDASGALREFDFHVAALTDPPRAIAPGETVRVHVHVPLPTLPPGDYRVEIDCVAAHVTWFAQAGSRTVVIELRA